MYRSGLLSCTGLACYQLGLLNFSLWKRTSIAKKLKHPYSQEKENIKQASLQRDLFVARYKVLLIVKWESLENLYCFKYILIKSINCFYKTWWSRRLLQTSTGAVAFLQYAYSSKNPENYLNAWLSHTQTPLII